MKPTPPPKILLRFFRWYCDPDLVDHIEGDLIETYQEKCRTQGRQSANMRLVIELIRLCRPGIIRAWRPQHVNTFGMYKNFMVIAWRNFQKSAGYSTINLLGLAVALCSCLLIMLYVQHELSFDHFFPNADRIYRVNNEIRFGDNYVDVALAPAPFASAAKAELSQVVTSTRMQWHSSILIRKGDENVRQQDVASADSTLFDVFDLHIISGDAKRALSEPNTIVLSETVARKIFGRTDVAGETVTVDNDKSRKVTAVFRDLPPNSHFRFTCFVPLMESPSANENIWGGSQNYATYLLLAPGTDIAATTAALNKMMERNLGPEVKAILNKTLDEFMAQGDYFRATLTPLQDIHLHSNRIGELYGSGRIENVYMFSAVALFILIIAIINFMNLATARSANRAREVGVRKVLGSQKSSLIHQFMTESLLTCTLSIVVAVALTALLMSPFNQLVGKELEVSQLYSSRMLLTLLILLVVVGVLSGTYPAFYLSAFQPADALKKGRSGAGRSRVRNVLVVFQFAASVALIAGTLVIYLQMDYMRTRDLGFSRQQLLIINNTGPIRPRIDALKNSLLGLNGVEKATVSGFLPVGYARSNHTFFLTPTLNVSGSINMQAWTVDEQYTNTLDMHIIQGRGFSKDMASDSSAIILNESAVRFLGGKDVIGTILYSPDNEKVIVWKVIGVVKDFHFSSMHEEVKPLALVYGDDPTNITLRLNTEDIPALMDRVEKAWKALVPEMPFEYSFMDQDYNRYYADEARVGKLFTVFATLSIFISCLGLLGLATYMAEQRAKEIGIRKVLGASVYGITSLLSLDFLKLVGISIAIAIPLSWYGTHRWLQSFAYRAEISWWVFALAGLTAILIACLTVSYQSIRAAVSNPVNSLRAD